MRRLLTPFSSYISILLVALMIALFAGKPQISFAIDETLPGYVTYIVDDTITIEIVGPFALKPQDTGVIMVRGREAAYVKITEISSKYLYLQIISQDSTVPLVTGDSIVFESRIRFDSAAAADAGRWRALDEVVLGGALDQNTTGQAETWKPVTLLNMIAPSTTPTKPSEPSVAASTATTPGVKNQNLSNQLAPAASVVASRSGNTRDSNLFHGTVKVREVYQETPAFSQYSSQSRLDTDGTLERIYGGPWSAIWNGNITYRDGNENFGNDYRYARAHLYTAMLSKRMEDGGTWKMGRLLSNELPGLGFLDGTQLEHVLSSKWRIGGLAALRPDRTNLAPASKEPVGAAYATTEQGEHGKLYYSGTMGLLQTMYRGSLDELALLYDHRMDIGPKLNIFATSQLDFDAGAAEIHGGPRLTRLDFYGSSPILKWLTLRSGLSHFERADTAAERDLSGGTLVGFDSGYWRYFFGANQTLPWQLTTDEEISTIHGSNQVSDGQWRLSVSRFGLFFLRNAQLTLSAYNLTALEGHGVACQATSSLPIYANKVMLFVSTDGQYSSPADTTEKDFRINDASARLMYRITKAWSADAGLTRTFQSNITSTIGDASLGYRW